MQDEVNTKVVAIAVKGGKITAEVLEKALEKASTEKTMRKAIENGMLVTEAFAKFGVL